MSLSIECSICSRDEDVRFICHKCQKPMCDEHHHSVHHLAPFTVYYCKNCFTLAIFLRKVQGVLAALLTPFTKQLIQWQKHWQDNYWFWLKRL